MDLILWRHAEAEDLPEGVVDAQRDLERKLTSRGEKQAARMAEWLDRQLPGSARTLVSPARRCEQTALALGRKFKTRVELAPGAAPEDVLELVQWPLSKTPVLVIGHQPTLGQVIARLLGLVDSDCAIKKGALWWLRTRERDGQVQAVVVTVQSPELL
ncbi:MULTISPECIES: SixA phosphatase family protein [Polaromonas]|uniref:Phosphohistidine phosphatase, SixA n=2 Tax=Polaromonas TaxID=52972 RepID=A1VPE1_POLNA|nr:histidine phosphatase family protein [Polaromonas naphthalenivorans]ABM37519.1 phosphohistidine phosphatase, SixA [Polaromonas naphthalenivorans CJ2]MBH2008763.1 histidine phosphatase family protein [Xanthomonadaceae bacterium]